MVFFSVYFSAVVIWAFGLSSIVSVDIVWGGKVMSYTADSQQGALGVLSWAVFGSSHVAGFKGYPGNRNPCVAGSQGSLTGSPINPTGGRDVRPTWNMILYCSSGRLTTHMLQPMMASGAWRLCRLFRGTLWENDPPLTSDLLMSRPLLSWPLTHNQCSGQNLKTGFWISCLQSWGFWMGRDLCLFFDQKPFQFFLHHFWFLSQQHYDKIVLSVKKCASFTSQTFIKTAESRVHLLLWTWQNVCCAVLKWKKQWEGTDSICRPVGGGGIAVRDEFLFMRGRLFQPCKWGGGGGRGRVCASVCQKGEGTRLVCGRRRCECVSARTVLSCGSGNKKCHFSQINSERSESQSPNLKSEFVKYLMFRCLNFCLEVRRKLKQSNKERTDFKQKSFVLK